MKSEIESIIQQLKRLGNPESVEGMKRFGITPEHTFGVRIPELRALGKTLGRNHDLALALWAIDTRETRILASIVDEPKKLTPKQMDVWAKEFSYWELCDQVCMNLFEKSPLAWNKAIEWSESEHEFVKRAGFVLMARLAVSDKRSTDARFEEFFPIIVRESGDNRNNVKKAVNWALRQIGKRNRALNEKAIHVAEEIHALDSPAAKWIASDALRELRSRSDSLKR